VAGQIGERTIRDVSTYPPIVSFVEYVLDFPDADDLIQAHPVYLVSARMAGMLEAAQLDGFTLEDALVVLNDQYRELYGDARHPEYRWLRLQSTPNADCWLNDELRLCVSDRMMSVLSQGKLDDCEVVPLQ
jgi:hypothetical protein